MRQLLAILLLAPVAVMGCQQQSTEKTPDTSYETKAKPAPAAQPATAPATSTDLTLSGQTVELGCAHCTYHKEGVTSCEPGIKVGNQVYKVSGADDFMAEYGGHALCSKPIKVKVDGAISGDTLVASAMELEL